MSQALVDQYGKPLNMGRHATGPSRDSGAFRGTIANWHPHRLANVDAGIREREVIQRRAADLAANDWAAKSGIRTIADNAVGTGLVPKSTIPHKLMGISREDAAAIGEKMEWAWSVWSREAHARGIAHAEDLQYLGISSVLRLGEMLHLPVMLPLENGRTFSLALQDMNPIRLATPADKSTDLTIRDGIEFTEYGRPEHYWIACPRPSLVPVDMRQLFSDSFIRRPAHIGHRPNVFHLFHCEEEEQIRGVSALSVGMKLFRNLNDALDSELFAQVIAASFPVFMALEDGTANLPPEVSEAYGLGGKIEAAVREMDFGPGTVTFGRPGEKPQVLESKRPGSNFPPFVEIIERSLAAMLGIPYESFTKDYSKTNYSSMRAALNEAWKLYLFYRRWFSRLYTQPLLEMVVEEAYLRNFLGLADDINAIGGPGFYEGRAYWCSATWVGPARGFIDPVKEIQAIIMALENNLSTYGEAWAERGGDFADALPIMEEERLALQRLPELKKAVPAKPAQQREKPEEEPEMEDDAEREDKEAAS